MRFKEFFKKQEPNLNEMLGFSWGLTPEQKRVYKAYKQEIDQIKQGKQITLAAAVDEFLQQLPAQGQLRKLYQSVDPERQVGQLKAAPFSFDNNSRPSNWKNYTY